jgi:hypothetical protein
VKEILTFKIKKIVACETANNLTGINNEQLIDLFALLLNSKIIYDAL